MGATRKLQRSAKNVRNLSKNPYREIERIWAEHGVVRIQGKDGKLYTKTVRQAAMTAMQLNAGLPPEGYTSRKHMLKLIEDLKTACREAQSQHETPKDTTEKAVTQAIQDHFTYDLNDSPLLLAGIKAAALKYPHLDRDEIRIVLKREDMTDKLKDDMMREVNKDRMSQLMKGVLPQPDIFSAGARL